VLNPWTIQQLAKMELAKNLKTAELFRLSQQGSLNQKRSSRIIHVIFHHIGKLMVSFGISVQKRYGITIN
jgi:hypothetical protein